VLPRLFTKSKRRVPIDDVLPRTLTPPTPHPQKNTPQLKTDLRKRWAADTEAKAARAAGAAEARAARAAARHATAVTARAARKAAAADEPARASAAADTAAASAAAAARAAAWRRAVAAIYAEVSAARKDRLLALSAHWIGDDPAAIAARAEEALAHPVPLFPGDDGVPGAAAGAPAAARKKRVAAPAVAEDGIGSGVGKGAVGPPPGQV
jgi:hypothetical protein